MKTTAALLCAIALLSSTARADRGGWTNAAPYRYDRALVNDDDVQSARAMKISGATLTAVGSALAVTALAVGIVDWIERLNFFGPDRPPGAQTFAAVGAGVGSAALLGTGIPLLVIGGHRLRAIQRDLRLGFAPAPSPSSDRRAAGGSVSLTVRF